MEALHQTWCFGIDACHVELKREAFPHHVVKQLSHPEAVMPVGVADVCRFIQLSVADLPGRLNNSVSVIKKKKPVNKPWFQWLYFGMRVRT